MLISDQAKDLVKNCVEGGGCMSPFQPLVLNKSTVSESRKVPCDNLCGESERFTEQFDDVLPVLSVGIL